MKTKKSILIVFVLLISNYLMAQNSINIGGTFTSSQTVTSMQSYNLQGKTVSVSGRADFALNRGFVRILLSDDNGYDLLIYETTPLFANDGVDIFTSKATETINLSSAFTFTKVKVEIEKAQLTNLVINVSDNYTAPRLSDQK